MSTTPAFTPIPEVKMESAEPPTDATNSNDANGGGNTTKTSNSTGTSASSASSSIRSRITVVCAECKRLKLKCDRRNPCSSCEKRDCRQRCVYSQAAAEKIDVQSLHNRILVLEALVLPAQRSGTSATALPPSVFPPQYLTPSNAAPSPSQTVPAASDPAGPPPPLSGLAHSDRALLAVGQAGSSLTIPLEDVASIWLEDLDLGSDLLSSNPSQHGPPAVLTLEPASATTGASLNPDTFFPPLSGYFLPGNPVATPNAALPVSVSDLQVMPSLVSLLPRDARTRGVLLGKAEQVLRLRPSFNWPHFRARVQSLFSWADAPASPASTRPSISFLAAAAAALALGASLAKDELVDAPGKPDAAALYGLSTHALHVFELAHAFDLDYLVACILQLLFLLHEPAEAQRNAGASAGLRNEAFPLVGKMVNIARMMGLQHDPDEFPGRYSLFEAETRRRIWWDVCYYDVFVSDCIGQSPLIDDGAHTTKFPAEIDEDMFAPNSTMISAPGAYCNNSSAYLLQKIKLAQLVKYVKKQTYHNPADPSIAPIIDTAAQLEQEVRQWLEELPTQFRLEPDTGVKGSESPSSAGVSPILIAQRCELAIVAHRIILKLYQPFLRVKAGGVPPHQAYLGTVNAAHAIVRASRLLRVSSTQSPRPTKSAVLFYATGRSLFDAAVVCAHAVIHQPNSIWARVAHEDAESALGLMRADASGSDEAPWEGIVVVERLLRKAAVAMGIEQPEEVASPQGSLKRKRSTGDGASFRLPYVGVGVTIPRPKRPEVDTKTILATAVDVPVLSVAPPVVSNPPAMTESVPPSRRRNASHHPESAPLPTRKELKAAGKNSYPTTGYRVRTPRDPSLPTPTRKSSVHHPSFPPTVPPSVAPSREPSVPHSYVTSPIDENDHPMSESRESVAMGGHSFYGIPTAEHREETPFSANMSFVTPQHQQIHAPGPPSSYGLPTAENSPYSGTSSELGPANVSSPFVSTMLPPAPDTPFTPATGTPVTTEHPGVMVYQQPVSMQEYYVQQAAFSSGLIDTRVEELAAPAAPPTSWQHQPQPPPQQIESMWVAYDWR